MATKSRKAKASSGRAGSGGRASAASEPQTLAAPQVSQSARRIDFRQAQVVGGIVSGTYILIVSGTKPYLNMDVHLSPLIYVRRPEYWGIEVIGTLSGIGIPRTAPYHVYLDLTGLTGTKGVEVLGAKTRKRIDVPPKGGGKKSK